MVVGNYRMQRKEVPVKGYTKEEVERRCKDMLRNYDVYQPVRKIVVNGNTRWMAVMRLRDKEDKR